MPGDRRLMVLREEERPMGFAYWRDCSGSPGSLEHMTPLLIPLISPGNSLPDLSAKKDPPSSVSSGYVWHLYPTMIFVDMDTAQFYQPPMAAGTRKDGQPAVSGLRPSTALGPSEKGKGTLLNHDQIENLDMTGPSIKEPLNPFHMSASNPNGIEADAGGTVLRPYCLNKRELTFPDISNGLITVHDRSLSSFTQDDDLPSITDLLSNPGEVQEWQGPGLNDGHETEGSKGTFKNTAEDDCNSTAGPRLGKGEHTGRYIYCTCR